MMCMTVLHGGVCHRTSTRHKSGIKMKDKKKKNVLTKLMSWSGGILSSPLPPSPSGWVNTNSSSTITKTPHSYLHGP